MITRGKFLLWTLLLLFPAIAIGIVLTIFTMSAEPAEDLKIVNTVPAFELTDQDGQPFPSSKLDGEVWIADFIFTRCSGPCPRMSLGMKKLQGVLEKEPDVRLVSFSVDPDYDTPEILKDYAEGYGAKADRWTFLTGSGKTIRDLARHGFYLGSPELKDDQGRVVHSIYFALVDKKGQIRGYYNGLEEEAQERLAADVRRLVKD